MLNRKIVKQVQLSKQGGLFVPGVMELKRTLNQKHYPSIKMELCYAGILCNLTKENQEHTFIVPFNQTECIVLDEESNIKRTELKLASND